MARAKPTPIPEVREGLLRGIAAAVASLEGIVALFEEKLGSDVTPTGRANRAFNDLTLHPEVDRAVGQLFADGHYANAVEDACKVLDGLVKLRSGRSDLGGNELMQTVFSPKDPVLALNDLQTDTGRSEQQGMMFLYAGTMLALRNPRRMSLFATTPRTHLSILD